MLSSIQLAMQSTAYPNTECDIATDPLSSRFNAFDGTAWSSTALVPHRNDPSGLFDLPLRPARGRDTRKQSLNDRQFRIEVSLHVPDFVSALTRLFHSMVPDISNTASSKSQSIISLRTPTGVTTSTCSSEASILRHFMLAVYWYVYARMICDCA
jgi:hypothetical protein